MSNRKETVLRSFFALFDGISTFSEIRPKLLEVLSPTLKLVTPTGDFSGDQYLGIISKLVRAKAVAEVQHVSHVDTHPMCLDYSVIWKFPDSQAEPRRPESGRAFFNDATQLCLLEVKDDTEYRTVPDVSELTEKLGRYFALFDGVHRYSDAKQHLLAMYHPDFHYITRDGEMSASEYLSVVRRMMDRSLKVNVKSMDAVAHHPLCVDYQVEMQFAGGETRLERGRAFFSETRKLLIALEERDGEYRTLGSQQVEHMAALKRYFDLFDGKHSFNDAKGHLEKILHPSLKVTTIDSRRLGREEWMQHLRRSMDKGVASRVASIHATEGDKRALDFTVNSTFRGETGRARLVEHGRASFTQGVISELRFTTNDQ